MGEYKVVVEILGLRGVQFTTRLIAQSQEEANAIALNECKRLYCKAKIKRLGFRVLETELIREL